MSLFEDILNETRRIPSWLVSVNVGSLQNFVVVVAVVEKDSGSLSDFTSFYASRVLDANDFAIKDHNNLKKKIFFSDLCTP